MDIGCNAFGFGWLFGCGPGRTTDPVAGTRTGCAARNTTAANHIAYSRSPGRSNRPTFTPNSSVYGRQPNRRTNRRSLPHARRSRPEPAGGR